MQVKKGELLAFEHFGSQLGRDFYLADLESESQIVDLFDLSQILKADITTEGWKYLFTRFGIQKLFEIDKISCWWDTEDKEDWIDSLFYHSLIGGYNPLTGSTGEWDGESNLFITDESKVEIDWIAIRKLHEKLL